MQHFHNFNLKHVTQICERFQFHIPKMSILGPNQLSLAINNVVVPIHNNILTVLNIPPLFFSIANTDNGITPHAN